MNIKEKNNQLIVETVIYQAKNGSVYLDWGNTVIKLSKDDAESICFDIPDFDVDDFNRYYSNN
jgi:hypothetical protein